MAAIFDFQHTQTSDSIPTCLFVLPDPENIGILLLSGIEAEKYVIEGTSLNNGTLIVYTIATNLSFPTFLPFTFQFLTARQHTKMLLDNSIVRLQCF